MKVFKAPQQRNDKHRYIVLWGSGTIGSAIEQALRNRGFSVQLSQKNQWNHTATLTRDALHSLSTEQLEVADSVQHIYAAGIASFASSQQQCDGELAAWNGVLDGVAEQTARHSQLADSEPVQMHLVSSAGGLFEGMTNVSTATETHPRRAYGHLKLAQENTLLERFGDSRGHIYRLSSVYGAPHPERRGSLITNLIRNSYAHKVTQVTGNLDTLRDYVHAYDAATYIVDRALATNHSAGKPLLLASGRSSSILEVLRIIEQSIRRKPLVAFVNAHNAAPISFLPSALAQGFQPAGLRTRISTLRVFPAPA